MRAATRAERASDDGNNRRCRQGRRLCRRYPQDVTFGAKLLLVAAHAGLFDAAPAASPPHYVYRDVAFVTIVGHGSVRTTPRGIDCPGVCRRLFPRGTHIGFRAAASPGWHFTGFKSKWCNASASTCVFDLVSPHDCIGGACPTGAFGVTARFVRDG